MRLLLLTRMWTLLAALASAALARAEAPRPDVLVILTDQWSPRYLSWENPQVRTPHLDAIAREGLIFDACYTPSPICMPARISLITGLYPHNAGHSVWGNATDYHVPVAAATLFCDIRRAGYSTAQIGKLHWTSGAGWKREFARMEDYHRALGLDTVVDVSGPPDSPHAHDPYCRRLRELGLLERVAADMRGRYLSGEYAPRASVVAPDDYHDSFVAQSAVEFIRRQPAGKPFCLVVSFHSPHPPLDAPGRYATMYAAESLRLPPNVPESFRREKRSIDRAEVRRMLANYLGKIALVDDAVGRLRKALEERGTWQRTLVAFTSDHGEMLGAQGFLTKGRFYEESARVPLVLRWPTHIAPGRTAALAQMFDLYPTLVEAIGSQVSPGRMARSLLPIALGKAPAVRDVVLSEIGKSPPLNLMARDRRYKWWADGDAEHLFDLQTDPFEMHDLADAPEHRATVSHMRKQALRELRIAQVNLSEGYQPKVQRLREAEKARRPK